MPLLKEESSSLYYQLGMYGAFARGEDFGYFANLPLEELLQIALEASRWDINLLYILVDFFATHYRELRLFRLRDLMNKNKTPQTIAIALEFAKKINKSKEFNEFFKLIIKNIRPTTSFRLYNIGRLLIIKNLREDWLFSQKEYKKWGFLCKEIPILKHHKIKSKDKMQKCERTDVLKQLFRDRGSIKLGDYLESVRNLITRQQAHRDIMSFRNIKYEGDKKGRKYFI